MAYPGDIPFVGPLRGTELVPIDTGGAVGVQCTTQQIANLSSGGSTPAAPIASMQFNAGNGSLGGTASATVNSTNGDIRVNRIFTGTGSITTSFYLSGYLYQTGITQWSSNRAGLVAYYEVTPASNNGQVMTGVVSNVFMPTASGSLREVIGFNGFTAVYNSSGFGADQKVFDGGWEVAGTATSSNAYGMYITEQVLQNGVVTNGYGIKIDTPNKDTTSTWSNAWAIYIADHSPVGSVASYNIYSAGASAKNLFAGKLYLPGLPTSDPATHDGQIWNDSGTLKVST